jgi:hypothetical protein
MSELSHSRNIMAELLRYTPRHYKVPRVAGLLVERTLESTEALENLTQFVRSLLSVRAPAKSRREPACTRKREASKSWGEAWRVETPHH